jgi:hypothetical protein
VPTFAADPGRKPMFHRLLATRPTSLPLVLRVAAGTLFVLLSFGKFVRRDAEVRAFENRASDVDASSSFGRGHHRSDRAAADTYGGRREETGDDQERGVRAERIGEGAQQEWTDPDRDPDPK